MLHRLSISILILFSFSACLTPKTSDPSDGEAGDGTTGDGTTGTVGVTIADIQQGVVGTDESVTLERVVVTTMMTTEGDGFFVQDPGGGEWSGIYLYTATMAGEFNPIVGDALRLSGKVSEYYDSTQLVISSAESIEVVGEEDVVATAISDVPSDWEPYEGVLVALEDQSVVSSVNNYGEVDLSMGIPMDNLFYDFDTEYGATYSSITGVMTYSFEQFKVCPRTDADLAGYSSGTGGGVTTVANIQSSSMLGGVEVEGVVVTTEPGDKGFWVQDAGGGEWSGIYVYTENASGTVPTVSIGDTIDIAGVADEYYDESQIKVSDGADITVVGSAAPVAVELSAAPSDWENYEGVLVSLSSLSVDSNPDQYGQCETNYDNLKLDDLLYSYDLSNGDSFDQMVGIIGYSYSEYKLYPRSSGDLDGSSTGTDTGTDTNTDTGDDPGSVAEIQQSGFSGNVTLSGLVATTGSMEEGFWVQDAGGGEWSGIYVYTANASGTVSVNRGDVVTISGEVDEFYDLTEWKVTNASDVVVTGSNASVSATELTSTPSSWENYEGVLVSLASVVIDGDADQYGQCNSNYNDLLIDDKFYSHGFGDGDTMDTLTGVINYTYGEFKLYPRDESDVVNLNSNGGSNNGGNATVVTVTDIQDGTVAVGSDVEVVGLIVTGVNSSGTQVYAQATSGSTNAGIMLYVSSGATVSVGDEISVQGEVSEFSTGSSSRTNIEVADAADIVVTGSGSITPTVVSAEPADWEAYEGMLIQLESVTVDSAIDQYGVSGLANYSISLDETLFAYSGGTASEGSSFSSVIGIVDDYYGYTLLPRSTVDFAQ